MIKKILLDLAIYATISAFLGVKYGLLFACGIAWQTVYSAYEMARTKKMQDAGAAKLAESLQVYEDALAKRKPSSYMKVQSRQDNSDLH